MPKDVEWLLTYAERLTEAAEEVSREAFWPDDTSPEVVKLRAILAETE